MLHVYSKLYPQIFAFYSSNMQYKLLDLFNTRLSRNVIFRNFRTHYCAESDMSIGCLYLTFLRSSFFRFEVSCAFPFWLPCPERCLIQYSNLGLKNFMSCKTQRSLGVRSGQTQAVYWIRLHIIKVCMIKIYSNVSLGAAYLKAKQKFNLNPS